MIVQVFRIGPLGPLVLGEMKYLPRVGELLWFADVEMGGPVRKVTEVNHTFDLQDRQIKVTLLVSPPMPE